MLEYGLTRVKRWLFPPGRKPRRPRGGLLRGLLFEIDFANQVQIYFGLSEQELIPWFHEYTSGVHTVVDVGAAEGRYTIPLLARTSVARVLACEPTERREGLRANLRLNGLDGDTRLEILPYFIGASDDGATARTLDSLLPKIDFPCLVKMDIEGAEALALRGAAGLLAREGVSWIIETHSPELEWECLEILEAAGYRATIVENARWRRFLPLPGLGPIGHSRWLAATNHPDHPPSRPGRDEDARS